MSPKDGIDLYVFNNIIAEQELRKPLIIRKFNEVLKLKGIMKYDDGK